MALRAKVEDDSAVAEPGHAVIRVRGWESGAEGVVCAITRRESPQHLGPEGWGSERVWLEPDRVEAEGSELRVYVGPAVVGRVDPETTLELQLDADGRQGPAVMRVAWHGVTPPYAGRTLGGARSVGAPAAPVEEGGRVRARSIAAATAPEPAPVEEPVPTPDEPSGEEPVPEATPPLRPAPALIVAAALLLLGLAVWAGVAALDAESDLPDGAPELADAEPPPQEPPPEPVAEADVAAAAPEPPARAEKPAPPSRTRPAMPEVGWWAEPDLSYAQHLVEAARAEKRGDEFRALFHYERALRQEPRASEPPRQIARLGGHPPAFGVAAMRAAADPLVFWSQEEGRRLPRERRKLDSRFASSALATVRAEARLSMPSDARSAGRIEHGMVWRPPDSAVRVLPLGETDMEVRADGWSCIATLTPEPGEAWQRGTHQVDFYFNGRKVSSGFFDVR